MNACPPTSHDPADCAATTLAARFVHCARAALTTCLVMALVGCASLPAEPARPQSTAQVASHGALVRLAQAHAAAAETGDREAQPALSGLRLLPTGDQAFEARLALIRRAESSLDAQYYLVHGDDSGQRFLRALRDAAQRGVRVRLLVDDLYAGGTDTLLTGLAAFPNVEVRLFNPLPVRGEGLAGRLLLSLHAFERINQRMHNKLLVADGVFGIVGGRNIGDEYFMRSSEANFIDLDLLASGPVVADMAASFDRYWNHPRAWPLSALLGAEAGGPGASNSASSSVTPSAAARRQAFSARVDTLPPDAPPAAFDLLGRTGVEAQFSAGRIDQHFAPVRLVADAPEKNPDQVGAMDTVLSAMLGARREVQIASPYFVPGERGLAMLREAAEHGIRIHLLTNSIAATDEPLVHQGYAAYRPRLLKLGVALHELNPQQADAGLRSFGRFGASAPRLHAKVAVVDGRRVLIGSLNMDARSARLNTELGLVIDSPALAAEVQQLMQQALAGTWQLRLQADGEQVAWQAGSGEQARLLHHEPGSHWWQRLRLQLLSLLVDERLL